MPLTIEEKIARGAGPARLRIAYVGRGNATLTRLLLTGLGGQMVAWPADL
jgi:hypothetical protein